MPESPRPEPTSEAEDLTLEQMLETAFRRDSRWVEGAATTYATAEPVPERLGRYSVLEPIGTGGVGLVYRVRDESLGRTIALKVLKPEFASDAASVRRFTEESQLLGQLAHPGIVPLHEAGTLEDGRPYFTMRLVEGKTFAELLRRKATSSEDRQHALHVLRSTCEALGYAHSLGIVHGDVKPGNVMVGAFGEVQLMDFGFARRARGAAAGAESRRPSAGTPAYMAPEQARSEDGNISERTDVFGIGGILCEILTQQPPHGGASRESVIAHAAAAELEPAFARIRASGADMGLVAIALTCLAADPAARPADAGEVAARIAAYQDGVEERAHAADLAAAAARASLAQTRRTQRLTIALVCAIALAIVVVVTLIAGTERQSLLRRTATSASVSEAMAEAKRLELAATERSGQEHDEDVERLLRDALSSVGRAEAVARTSDGDEGSLASVLAAKARLELRAGNLAKVRTLRKRLGNLRHHVGDGRSARELETGYSEAFGGFGAYDDTTPAEAAKTLAALESPEDRAMAIEALDDWCVVRRQSGLPERESWRRTAAVLRAFDRDPWRDALRDAWVASDTSRLEALAREQIDEQHAEFSLALLGRQLVAAGRVQTARDFYRRACAAHPESARLCHDHAMLVGTTGSLSDPATSIRMLWMATASAPHDAHLLVDLGLALVEANEDGAALPVLERAVRKAPGDARAWFVLSLARRRCDAPRSEVSAALEESVRLGSMPARVLLADDRQAEGRLADAMRLLEPFVEHAPQDASACRTLALLCQKTGNIARARALAEPFAKLPSETARMAIGLGWVALDSSSFGEAAKRFAEAATLARDQEPGLVAAASAFAQRARDAGELASKLATIPDDVELPGNHARLRTIAFVARRAGRALLAARAYEHLISTAAQDDGVSDDEVFDGAVAAMDAAQQQPQQAEAWKKRSLAWLGELVTRLEGSDQDDPAPSSYARSIWHALMLTPALQPLWVRGPESRGSASSLGSLGSEAADLLSRLDALGKALGLR